MRLLSRQSKCVGFQQSFFTLVLLVLLAGCSQNGFFQPIESSSSPNSTSSTGSSGTTNEVSVTPTPNASPSPSMTSTPSFSLQPLSWESSSHPERRAWSTALQGIIATYFTQLDKASDTTLFCPTYKSLSRDQKINVWADIFASDAYYESGWVPTEYSVDVGTANDDNTWSVGLLQMSVVDQQNYGFKFGFTFTDLQDPVKNLQLAVAVMSKQITNHGVILVPVGSSGLYWSTLHPGGTYDKSASIEAMVKKLSFCK